MTTDAEMDGLRTNAYNKALSIQDELFHSSLYDRYLSRGMTDQLLEVRRLFLHDSSSDSSNFSPLSLAATRLGHRTLKAISRASRRRWRRATCYGNITCACRITRQLPLF